MAYYVHHECKPRMQIVQNYFKWLKVDIFTIKVFFKNPISTRIIFAFFFCIFLRAVSAETVSLKACNLFLSKCVQDQYLLQLLKNADSISTWVAAEIVTCHTTKVCHCLLYY